MKKVENQYLNIKINYAALSREEREIIDRLAFDDYNCLGKHCFEMNEGQVDQVLKEAAFTSANISDEQIDQIENLMSGDIIGYFFMANEGKDFLSKIENQCEVLGCENIDFEDWNKEWKKSYQKIEVSENLAVLPSWEKTNDKISEIYINPGMGFGTGTHETTYLCLKQFETILDQLEEGSECLDFGCGSGILGIAAFKKKKLRVDFCDVDTHALENCHQNILLNDYENYGKGHEIVLRERINFENKKYDLIFANILEFVLVEEKRAILDNIKNGGYVILSGVLTEQEENILNHYKDLKKISTLEKNNWISILLQK